MAEPAARLVPTPAGGQWAQKWMSRPARNAAVSPIVGAVSGRVVGVGDDQDVSARPEPRQGPAEGVRLEMEIAEQEQVDRS